MSDSNKKSSSEADLSSIRHRDFMLDWFERVSHERENQKEHHKKTDLQWGTARQMNIATLILAVFQVTLIILFATVGGSQTLDETAAGTVTQGYNMFIGVEVMMFVGFGYLMTFLKWYGLSAVGFTMLVTAVALQWDLFTQSFFTQLMNNLDSWYAVPLNIYCLLDALYACSAVLISFGALIGKISPAQLVVMALIEIPLHSFHYKVLMYEIGVADIGGTYIDHMFGAYFGLAVAYMLGPPTVQPEFGNTPDIFSLIGTVFLWVYWPSFVAGAAAADSDQQARALVNTILALSSSTVLAFMTSSYLENGKKFRPVDIQNATLAGGVAIGCTANLTLSGFGAIMIGAASGLWSTIGYSVIMSYLDTVWKIHDSCGVHNLHGMPSVIGAIASVFIAGYKGDQGRNRDADIYGADRSTSQWWRQWVGMITCIGFAVLMGLIVGKILLWVGQCTGQPDEQSSPTTEKPYYQDNQWWEVAEDYGRSLYTELGLVVKSVDRETSTGNGVPPLNAEVERAITDYSSHHGRAGKPIGDILSLSGHSGHGKNSSNHARRVPSKDVDAGTGSTVEMQGMDKI